MNGPERGFLLLTGYLGNSDRHPLTVAQFRELTKRARLMEKPLEDRELTVKDLQMIGCDKTFAERVMNLLAAEEELDWYLQTAKRCQCIPITRLNTNYPAAVREKLALEAPACLWAKGNIEILNCPMIALVGSRELQTENRIFAEEVGKQAALQGYTLVSGNARGADRTAQESCLAHGGNVISIVADRLDQQITQDHVLYLSDEGYDLHFSSIRALSRNRLIHTLAEKTFIAQCTYGRGGTWGGAVQNLRWNWSPIFCYQDHTQGTLELIQRGAVGVFKEDLQNIGSLQPDALQLF